MNKIAEKGYLYIAYGEAFTKEALMSIESLRRYTDLPIAIYCAGGYRSMIAASFLQKEGFSNITNIQGGFSKLKLFDIKIVESQSCSKL